VYKIYDFSIGLFDFMGSTKGEDLKLVTKATKRITSCITTAKEKHQISIVLNCPVKLILNQ
jgi:hypothetical protein